LCPSGEQLGPSSKNREFSTQVRNVSLLVYVEAYFLPCVGELKKLVEASKEIVDFVRNDG